MTGLDLNVSPQARGGIIAIGNFDGVHRGHQAMLKQVTEIAARTGVPAVVVSFDPHPVCILRPDVVLPRLTTMSERTLLLKSHGADEVVVLPTSQQLLNMSPDEFFELVVLKQLGAVGIVEGPDFRFGKDRTGNVHVLRSLCENSGLSLDVIEPVQNSEQMISSTRVRRHLQDGEIEAANDLLGHGYTVTGTVTTGAGRGRTIGVPTANLTAIANLLPGDGVYAGCTSFGKVMHAVAINIGPNPTFDDQQRKVECHIIGFHGDLYDQSLRIEFHSRIRNAKRFDSADELIQEIQEDLKECEARFQRADGREFL